MPNPFKTVISTSATYIIGGLIASGVFAGYGWLRDFDSSGNQIAAPRPATLEFNAFVSGTGHTANTERRAAVCIQNPLTQLETSLGSGRLFSLEVHIGNNPATARGDVYFTKNCNDKTSTGHQLLIDNTCVTQSGCLSTLASPLALTGAIWNGADYIKLVLTKDPTSSFTARIKGTYGDLYGE